MIIIKFGGTSVSTKERLDTICQIVEREKDRQPVIVVSAIRGVTDLLLASLDVSLKERQTIIAKIETIHRGLVKTYWKNDNMPEIDAYLQNCLQQIEKVLRKELRSKAIADTIVSYGEKLSSFIVSKALETTGISSCQVIATELIVTNDEFGSAEFLPTPTTNTSAEHLLPLINKGIVPVVTGYIGGTQDGQTTTLGRGGSDYSAAVLGFALHAKEIQIWTDVDGIFTSDPRLVKDAKAIPTISYKEASELAAFGAKVLHPRTLRPAVNAGIPVRVLNTLNPSLPGTFITEKASQKNHCTAIAFKRNITLVNIYSTDMLFSKGFLARVFAIFAKYNISVNLVSVSEVSISVSLDNDEYLQRAKNELQEFTEVTIAKDFGMVSLIGDGIVGIKNILGDIFSHLDNASITVKMISLGASDINISLVIQSSDVDKAVLLIHRKLIIEKGDTL